MPTLQRHDIVKRWNTPKGELRKVVDYVAYAVSGNAHNPTVTYHWELWNRGVCLDHSRIQSQLLDSWGLLRRDLQPIA